MSKVVFYLFAVDDIEVLNTYITSMDDDHIVNDKKRKDSLKHFQYPLICREYAKSFTAPQNHSHSSNVV